MCTELYGELCHYSLVRLELYLHCVLIWIKCLILPCV